MLSKFLHWPTSKLFVLFLFIAQWQILFVRLDCERINSVIGSDGRGYYEYLQRTIIQRDYPFALPVFGKEKSAIGVGVNDTRTDFTVNKYFFGEALALLPFFLSADMLTQALQPDLRDGYSAYYQIAISIAALCYLLLGLWMLSRLLKRMNYPRPVINVVLLLVFLGTNLYYYALQEPSMSHVYSFAIIATFLDQLHLQISSVKPWRWIYLSVLISWIVLLRPINIVIALSLLTFTGSVTSLKQFIYSAFSKQRYILLALLIPFVFVAVQSCFYFVQTGFWWVDSYGEEGFDFSKPEILNVLFSFRKGLFVYTPLLFLVFPGLWFYYKREGSFSAISWFLIILVHWYITSSWWYWAYGGSYGMRPLIDFFPFYLIAIAALIEKAFKHNFSLKALVLIVSLGILLNLFQIWQYVQSILPNERMNAAKYSHIFLQTQRHFRFLYLSEENSDPFSLYSNEIIAKFDYHPAGELISELSNRPTKRNAIELITGKFSDLLNDSLLPSCWLEISGTFKMQDASSDAAIITSIGQTEPWFWDRRFLIQSIDKDNEWKQIRVKVNLPNVSNPADILKVSIVNDHKSILEYKSVQITLLKK
jgi:hypothetical protein